MKRSKRLILAIFLLIVLPIGAAGAAEMANESKTGTTVEPGTRTATFSMYCYWTGEATLGRVDGVVASRIGHWGGDEIVQVDYDPTRTNLTELTRVLKRQRSFDAVVVRDDAERTAVEGVVGSREIELHRGEPHLIEPKHSLRTRYPALSKLDLTEAQAIALNSWSYFGGSMPSVLTVEQKEALARAER